MNLFLYSYACSECETGAEQMKKNNKSEQYGIFLTILSWGALWGIFEATADYLLHAVSFDYSWLIWYPAACFFMSNVYRKTGKISSICFIGLLCAAIKLLNLFLPGRIDKVINPAVSIVFEALAMAAVVFAVNRLAKRKNPFVKAIAALATNTGWRVLYILYLLFLVPAWIRDVSVISSVDKFILFFVAQNLITSAIIFIGYQFKPYLLKPVEFLENRIEKINEKKQYRTSVILHAGITALLLCTNVVLQMILK